MVHYMRAWTLVAIHVHAIAGFWDRVCSRKGGVRRRRDCQNINDLWPSAKSGGRLGPPPSKPQAVKPAVKTAAVPGPLLSPSWRRSGPGGAACGGIAGRRWFTAMTRARAPPSSAMGSAGLGGTRRSSGGGSSGMDFASIFAGGWAFGFSHSGDCKRAPTPPRCQTADAYINITK